MSEVYKIVFMGLDFAGKTSILKILEGSYSNLDQIKPTLGTERTQWNILGFNVMNWDLGGQKKYREEYLRNYEQVLQDTNLLIFVIDLQDEERFNEAGAYFDDILHALDHLQIRCPIVLCLHKVDPDILGNAPIIKNLNWVTNLFSDYSEKHDVEIKVFVTSIFDRKTLVEMFSYGIGKLIPVGILSQLLSEFLQEVEKLGCVGVILFDMNFFVVGNAFPDLKTKTTCLRTINAFTSLMRDFRGVYEEDHEISFDLSILNGNTYKFRLFRITEITSPYYLLIMGLPSVKSEEIYSLFREKYVPKIEKSLHDLITSID